MHNCKRMETAFFELSAFGSMSRNYRNENETVGNAMATTADSP